MKLRFTIRDMLWLAVVIALVAAWMFDRQKHHFGYYEHAIGVLNERLAEDATKAKVIADDNAFLRSFIQDRWHEKLPQR